MTPALAAAALLLLVLLLSGCFLVRATPVPTRREIRTWCAVEAVMIGLYASDSAAQDSVLRLVVERGRRQQIAVRVAPGHRIVCSAVTVGG